MNAIIQARNAYRGGAQPARTDQDIEYEIFARVTSRLNAAAARQGCFADLVAAITDNRRLWNLMLADLAGDANGLPDTLRAGLISLAEFTRQYSSKVLTQQEPVAPLIEINRAVMAGLRGSGAKL